MNEPVAMWTTLGTLIGAVLAGLLYQYTSMENAVVEAVVALVVFLVPFLAGIWYARSKVTPVANPKDNDGNALVPAGGDV